MRFVNKDIKRELLEFGIVVALLLGIIGAFHAFGETVATLPYQVPYGCRWQECSVKGDKLVDCEPIQYGSHVALAAAIEKETKGAVRYECGPGQGERK